MALVCKKCNSGISIAKFYPGDEHNAGWNQYSLNPNRVNYFFHIHNHKLDASMWGGNQYELRYEIDDDTWQHDQLQGYEQWIDMQPTVTFSAGALEPAEPIIISSKPL